MKKILYAITQFYFDFIVEIFTTCAKLLGSETREDTK